MSKITSKIMKKILLIIFTSFILSSCSSFNFLKLKTSTSAISAKNSAISAKNKENEKFASQFISSNTDIPLIPGLIEINDEDLGFDSDSGSISSISYESEISSKEVQDFYLKTLPQMGWKLTNQDLEKLTFVRKKPKGVEKVEIGFTKKDGKKLVKFFISSGVIN